MASMSELVVAPSDSFSSCLDRRSVRDRSEQRSFEPGHPDCPVKPGVSGEIHLHLQDIFRSWGYKWWYLHPEVQAAIVDGGKIALANTGEIMRETQVLIVNRGITTPLTLPNGTMSYPSAEIPPMKVWSVHLGHKARENEVATYTDSLLKDVTVDPSDYEIDELAMPKVSEEDKTLALNMTLVRLMQFLAQDIHGHSMLMEDSAICEQVPSTNQEVLRDVTNLAANRTGQYNNRQHTEGGLPSRSSD
ncbi:hypothetical protein NEUTE1DRAFT_112574 [Neurospora tetrasperma FGSC 2508]|uniref:Uncharacterized protein n=1 Tax=Neurospora tetrasperma (strain FGSC 2508 / ATCC MYA-4615 / P0657) TaxID=510951 RepID=F8MVV7_NEUT8|nr:uncharacterized protein NEUTE1DRAFT_112574 [Neurospora tetrasperma FGSC 2508]EGO54005.1 hypothetical protein NEUTE1DRAFT_112574 [Neurospora tetrasperma FGSC 2508]EGZ68574.1 hypothetical protein NEUTE2DRAFT_74228 [Neurospora tetrasperma FGSC 2509]